MPCDNYLFSALSVPSLGFGFFFCQLKFFSPLICEDNFLPILCIPYLMTTPLLLESSLKHPVLFIKYVIILLVGDIALLEFMCGAVIGNFVPSHKDLFAC